MDIYEECNLLRTEVESAAVQALDLGDSQLFDYLADVSHASSRILETCDRIVNPQKTTSRDFNARGEDGMMDRGSRNDWGFDSIRSVPKSVNNDDNWANFDDFDDGNMGAEPLQYGMDAAPRGMDSASQYRGSVHGRDYSHQAPKFNAEFDRMSIHSRRHAQYDDFRSRGNVELERSYSTGYIPQNAVVSPDIQQAIDPKHMNESLETYYISLLEMCLDRGLQDRLSGKPLRSKVDILEESLSPHMEMMQDPHYTARSRMPDEASRPSVRNRQGAPAYDSHRSSVHGSHVTLGKDGSGHSQIYETQDSKPQATHVDVAAALREAHSDIISSVEKYKLCTTESVDRYEKMFKVQITPNSTVEHLVRAIPDGGLSCYLAKHAIGSDELFNCHRFTIYMKNDRFCTDGHTQVRVSLVPKTQGLDISLSIKGTRDTAASYNVKRGSEVILDAKVAVTPKFPKLVVTCVESDGSISSLTLDIPIGDFITLVPLKYTLDQFADLWSSIELSVSRQLRLFHCKSADVHNIVPLCLPLFSIYIHENILLLSSSGSDVILATIYVQNGILVVQIRSVCADLIASTFAILKELLSTIEVKEDAELAGRVLKGLDSLPIAFKKEEDHIPSGQEVKPVATKSTFSKPIPFRLEPGK
ncbi:hypothetical protein BEWA_002780 [Theileria equi strain WA]|uniref:Uncharacterized protein n=1 Tax=Theileria equi strain WA TaxID=1537102 RepID=L0B0U3_THEEQ|nr:hypothetical protein BEWA_002780 [Theileria equi strain WA]AFZ80871.1 hypothetical protein BEWA_002780 [Theileria equi strain WA]|eukprot:XP_004830537.1 hypothetical protein BEWA_002780 [Theileria equi strain WA]